MKLNSPLLTQVWGGGVFAEHLLNSRLQMRTSRATGEGVTQTKQTKIGPCEQVRVNWKTAAWLDRRPRRLESRREIGEGTRKGGPGRNDYRPRQCCHVWLQDSVSLFAQTRIPSSR